MTTTIYRINCTRGYQASECGSHYSLETWGNNTDYYEGDDDGGEEYILPAGYSTGECVDGTPGIFDPTGKYAAIVDGGHGPCLVRNTDGQLIPLAAAGGARCSSGVS